MINFDLAPLIEQATVVEYGVDNGFDRTTVDQKKFAELVIAEHEKTAKGDELIDTIVMLREYFMYFTGTKSTPDRFYTGMCFKGHKFVAEEALSRSWSPAVHGAEVGKVFNEHRGNQSN